MRKLQGTIVSTKMQKTAVVSIDTMKKHEKYQKYYRVTTRVKAHVEGDYRVGDVVIIQEVRPLSKEKRWKIVELVRRPAVASLEEDMAPLNPAEEKSII